MGGRLGPGPAQRRRLGAAAGLGDRLGVGREQDREPQPDRDLELEPAAGGPGDGLDAGDVGEPDQRHQRRRDLDHEHHRVADQQPRVELAERVREGRPEQLRIEDAARPGRLAADGFAPPRVTKRWKRRVPRPRSTDIRDRVRLMGSGHLSRVLDQLLDDRAQRERREERERADDDHDADQQHGPQRARSSGTSRARARPAAWRPSSPRGRGSGRSSRTAR